MHAWTDRSDRLNRVTDDLIGLNQTKIKFVKRFVNVKKYINAGIRKFASEVRSKKYPTKNYSY